MKNDILLVSEAKLDVSFTSNSFHLDCFTSPCKLDIFQNDKAQTVVKLEI